MFQQKVAVVTGANKGLGFEIVKNLCINYQGIVYLTSRNEKLGKKAVSKLKKLKLNPFYHQLDIDNVKSVDTFKDYIETNYQGVDVLINNAGVVFKPVSNVSFGNQAEITLKTNYYGTLRMIETFFPLLKNGAQVINVSSCTGHLTKVPSVELTNKLASNKLRIDDLTELMKEFVKSAKNGNNVELGWGSSAYNISKVAVSVLTRIQQRIANELYPNRNISINSCVPSWDSGDVLNRKGSLTLEERVRSVLFLALSPHGLKGQFIWSDCSVEDWTWWHHKRSFF